MEVVGIGLEEIRRSLRRRTCRELLSIGTGVTAERLEVSRAADQALLDAGVRLVSLYDYYSTDEGARAELARRGGWGNSYYCSSAVQLKIYDCRWVVMEIPPARKERTVIAVSDRAVVAEALRYYRVVRRTAVPVGAATAEEALPVFTERQHQVIRLLTTGRTDQEIAVALDVSLRTVRYDIAAINRGLGVTSRFAAGVRLTRLGMAG